MFRIFFGKIAQVIIKIHFDESLLIIPCDIHVLKMHLHI